MAAIATSRRTTEPDAPERATYEVTDTCGRTFTVRREHYADGPSLFTWLVDGPGLSAERTTKRACLSLIAGLAPTD